MSHPKQQHILTLELETLENRRMLAGNVDAFVTGGGDLVVNGDSQGNVISITSTDGGLRITGFSNTTINGVDSALELTGMDDDVRINMRNGSNTVVIADASIPDTLSIRTESGDDVIIFNVYDLPSIDIGGDLRINAGSGDDDVIVTAFFEGTNMVVGDDVNIRTGAGADVVDLTDMTVLDRLTVNTGDGSDTVRVGRQIGNQSTATVAGGRMSIRTGSGDDTIEMTKVQAQDRVSMNTGSGRDDVTIRQGQIAQRLSVSLGGDDDFILIKDISLSEARINGNGGQDTYRGIEGPVTSNFEDELILPC